jgi:light-regulated signal transduction histidine kinase (bacteriophytochrome)
MANSIIAELRKAEPKREVEVVVESGLRIQADERLLRVAVDNLLQNAWKFTGKTKRPKIEIGANFSSPEHTFFIRDNGAGFDLAYASRLFGVFQRLHTTSEFPGTGVGLATVQRIINRHGGRIWADSKVDQGTTFYFTLPEPAAGEIY